MLPPMPPGVGEGEGLAGLLELLLVELLIEEPPLALLLRALPTLLKLIVLLLLLLIRVPLVAAMRIPRVFSAAADIIQTSD
jgi:hypothetical protein